MDTLEYKGYCGSVEYDEDSGGLCGFALGLTRTGIQYQGNTLAELEQDFKEGVDFYLKDCAEDGTEPEKPRRVSIDVPFPVYEKIDELASKAGIHLSAYINRGAEVLAKAAP